MVFVYKIINSVSSKEYIGITSNVTNRWHSHIHSSKTKNTPLYASMRKYGVDKFNMQVICICPSWEYACDIEIKLITNSKFLYNLAAGGEGGFVVPEERKDEWKKKLSKSRQGRKPALGMKHTDENKKLFSEVSRKYWETKDTYEGGEILKHSFKDAHEIFGISKTHYYRLKRSMGNDHA